jgi:hypothetical protein
VSSSFSQRTDRRARVVGLCDLIAAGGLVYLAATELRLLGAIGAVYSADSAMGAMLCTLAAAPVVAVCGLWLLVDPRSGRHVAGCLGLLTVIATVSMVFQSLAVPSMSVVKTLWMAAPLLPAMAQVALAPWLRRT